MVKKQLLNPIAACIKPYTGAHYAQTALAGIAVFVLYFIEAQEIRINAGFHLCLWGHSFIPLPPLLYISISIGALLSGFWVSSSTFTKSCRSPRFFNGWFCCGLLGAALYLMAGHFVEQQPFLLLGTALLLGICLPKVVHGFFARASFLQQVMVLTVSSAIGEIVSIYGKTPHFGGWHALLLAGALLLVGTVAGRLDNVPKPHAQQCRQQIKKPQRSLWLLTVFSFLFFSLHYVHTENFYMYQSVQAAVPQWTQYALRLAFPLLGFIAWKWGLIPLAIFSTTLSVFDPVLDIIPQQQSSYTFVYILDRLSMQGGVFFITLAFMRLAPGLSKPALIRTLPLILLNFIYGSMLLLQSLTSLDQSILLLPSVCIVAVLMPIVILLHGSLFAHRAKDDDTTPPAPSQLQAEKTPQGDTASQPETAQDEASQTKNIQLDTTPWPDETPQKEETPYALRTQGFAESKAFSPRESEVFCLMVEGLNYAEIGARLFIAEATIKIHVSRIFKKSGVKNRAQLMSLLLHARLPERPL